MVRVAVLAGGWGRRLGPVTARRPKPLVPIAGRRILDYTLDEALAAGAGEALVVVNPRALPLPGLPSWARAVAQPGPGLASALRAALEWAGRGGGPLALSFTGYIARPRGILKAAIDYYHGSGFPVVMAVAPVTSGLETYGFARLGMGGRVERVSRELEEWLAGRGYVFAGALVGDRGARAPRARRLPRGPRLPGEGGGAGRGHMAGGLGGDRLPVGPPRGQEARGRRGDD